MDMMILGEVIRGKKGVVCYGFWMPAQGNDGSGGIEVSAASGLPTAKFTVSLQTKTDEDVDPAATANLIGSASITATGVTRFAVANAKQLVRYVVAAEDTVTDQYMHFQFLAPQWADN